MASLQARLEATFGSLASSQQPAWTPTEQQVFRAGAVQDRNSSDEEWEEKTRREAVPGELCWTKTRLPLWMKLLGRLPPGLPPATRPPPRAVLVVDSELCSHSCALQGSPRRLLRRTSPMRRGSGECWLGRTDAAAADVQRRQALTPSPSCFSAGPPPPSAGSWMQRRSTTRWMRWPWATSRATLARACRPATRRCGGGAAA